MEIAKHIGLITAVGQAYDINMFIDLAMLAMIGIFAGIAFCLYRKDKSYTALSHRTTGKVSEEYCSKANAAWKTCKILIISSIAVATVGIVLSFIPNTGHAIRRDYVNRNIEICAQCGAGNVSGALYCSTCGDEINEEDIKTISAWRKVKTAKADEKEKLCEVCMEVVDGNDTYCHNCGKEFDRH